MRTTSLFLGLAAILTLAAPVAFAQTVVNDTTSSCTADAECVRAAACGSDEISRTVFTSNGCVDHDLDPTTDTVCQYTVGTSQCGGGEYCYSGFCIGESRPSAPAVPDVCESVTIPASTCNGNVGFNHSGSVGEDSGSCVIETEEFHCQTHEVCLTAGGVAYCEDKAPSIMVDHRPANVGAEGGLSEATWERIVRYFTPFANAASQGPLECNEQYAELGSTQLNACSRLEGCFQAQGSSNEELMRVWTDAASLAPRR